MTRKTVMAITVLAGATLSAQSQIGQPPAAPTVLPLTRVVLYKSGVGYFEHLARVTGNQSLAVQFTADQLDDVLKSLSALDLGNGRVVDISYDSPTPVSRRLQALTLPLTGNEPTIGVLGALRGTRVDVRDASGAPVIGRLLNVERRSVPVGQRVEQEDRLSVLTDAGEITTLTLSPRTRVRVVDRSVRAELDRYLGISSTSGARVPRRVVVSTTGTGTRQVLIGYVGEAAVWKTTYRLIFPSTGGEPVLQGWGVVDNVSAADWNNVELSLIAGAPQAFRQPLSTPLFATRPAVAVPVPAGLAPQVHEGALVGGNASLSGAVTDPTGAVLPGVRVSVTQAGRVVQSIYTDALGRYDIAQLPPGTYDIHMALEGFTSVLISSQTLTAGAAAVRNATMSVGTMAETITVAASTPSTAPVPPPPPAARRIGGNLGGVTGGIVGGAGGGTYVAPGRAVVEQLATAVPIAASAGDLGDLFEYKLRDRVTIARNRSALVPILQARVSAERVSIWNAQMGNRPRRAVWITNSSDLTLDAGSLSIVDAGAFAGEGLVDTTKPGERRLVSYAGDLAVNISAEERERPSRLVRIQIGSGNLTRISEERRERIYTVRNNDRESRTLVIEHPANAGWALDPSVKPEESTASVHRLRLTIPSGQTRTLSVEEARRLSSAFELNAIGPEQLVLIAETPDQRTRVEPVLAPLFAKNADLARVRAEIQKRDAEIGSISADQQRVRQNMAALKSTTEERRLVGRYTRQLDEQETRLDALRAELGPLRDQALRLEQDIQQLVTTIAMDQAF